MRCGDDARNSRTSASYPEKSRGKSTATSPSAIRVSLDGRDESNVIVTGTTGFFVGWALARPALGTAASVATRAGISLQRIMRHLQRLAPGRVSDRKRGRPRGPAPHEADASDSYHWKRIPTCPWRGWPVVLVTYPK